MRLHQASFRAISPQRLKCLWTLMIQHLKRAAHVWHSGALGQGEKAFPFSMESIPSEGLCCLIAWDVRGVWSGFGEYPWDVETSTVQPQSETHDEKQAPKWKYERAGSRPRCRMYRSITLILSDLQPDTRLLPLMINGAGLRVTNAVFLSSISLTAPRPLSTMKHLSNVACFV